MRRRVAALCLLALGTLFLASPATPAIAADSGFFTGTIRNADTNAPIAGACVTIYDRTSVQVGQVCADGTGAFTTPQLSTTMPYRLRYTAPGYATQWYPGRTGMALAGQTLATVTGKTANAVLTQHFGTLKGKLQVPGGGTEPLHEVAITTTAGLFVALTATKTDGTYTVPDLPSGAYKILIAGLDGSLDQQWLPQAATVDDAATYTVADGQTVTADGQFATRLAATPLSPAAGIVAAGASSQGIAGATLRFITAETLLEFATVQTDSLGRYSLMAPDTVQYKVQVSAPGYPDQWMPATPSFAYARPFGGSSAFFRPDWIPVVKGWTSVHGRITAPNGAGLAGAQVYFQGRVLYGGPVTATTGADGTYEVTGLPESPTTLLVSHPDYGVQWYHQKPWEKQAEANVINLLANTPSQVDEQFSGRGRLAVTVLDWRTHAPIANACVRVEQPGRTIPEMCSGPDGKYAIENLAPGAISVAVSAAGHLTAYRSSSGAEGGYSLTIRSGQTTPLELYLRPSGSVVLPVQAKADGTYPRACAFPVVARIASNYADVAGYSGAYCNLDGSANTLDKITIPAFAAGPIQVFVAAHSDDLGAQWLGSAGGTGDQRQAAIINVPAGGSVTGPTIKLDKAGSIKGVTKAKGTLEPLAAVIRPFALQNNIDTYCSTSDTITGCSAANTGSFLIGGLGPYAWPISFSADGYALTWSGGVASRWDATGVQVRSGQTTVVNVTIPRGVKLTLNRGANPAAHYEIIAYDARTGDYAGETWYGAGSAMMVNPGDYHIAYDVYSTAGGRDCWLTWPNDKIGAPSQLTGLVHVTTAKTVSLVPGSTCRPVSEAALFRR